MNVRFIQASYEDEFKQKYVKIKESGKTEDYVGGLFVPIKGAIGKIYFIKGNTDTMEYVSKNTIFVVKQYKFIDTIRILIHELTHFAILKFFKDWQFLQKLLDKGQENYKFKREEEK